MQSLFEKRLNTISSPLHVYLSDPETVGQQSSNLQLKIGDAVEEHVVSDDMSVPYSR